MCKRTISKNYPVWIAAHVKVHKFIIWIANCHKINKVCNYNEYCRSLAVLSLRVFHWQHQHNLEISNNHLIVLRLPPILRPSMAPSEIKTKQIIRHKMAIYACIAWSRIAQLERKKKPKSVPDTVNLQHGHFYIFLIISKLQTIIWQLRYCVVLLLFKFSIVTNLILEI